MNDRRNVRNVPNPGHPPPTVLEFRPEELMENLVAMLQKEKKTLEKRVEALGHAIAGLGGDAVKDVKGAVKRGKKMSVATKAKLSAAAKARWAKVKKAAKV